MKIKGKTAVVTGGTSGLGEAVVRALVREEANVVIWGRNEQKGKQLEEELGVKTLFQSVDVRDNEAVSDGIEKAVALFGGLHIVGNIAGIAKPRLLIGRDGPSSLADFTDVLDVNLTAAYNVLRLSAWAMAKQEPVNEDGERGIIINTSSIAAWHGQRGQQAYSAAKGGLNALALPAARSLARNGIRVAGIAPGLFDTPIYGNSTELTESLSKEFIYPRRFGRPEEFASLFLEIVRNPMINGTTFRLDGAVRF